MYGEREGAKGRYAAAGIKFALNSTEDPAKDGERRKAIPSRNLESDMSLENVTCVFDFFIVTNTDENLQYV